MNRLLFVAALAACKSGPSTAPAPDPEPAVEPAPATPLPDPEPSSEVEVPEDGWKQPDDLPDPAEFGGHDKTYRQPARFALQVEDGDGGKVIKLKNIDDHAFIDYYPGASNGCGAYFIPLTLTAEDGSRYGNDFNSMPDQMCTMAILDADWKVIEPGASWELAQGVAAGARWIELTESKGGLKQEWAELPAGRYQAEAMGATAWLEL